MKKTMLILTELLPCAAVSSAAAHYVGDNHVLDLWYSKLSDWTREYMYAK